MINIVLFGPPGSGKGTQARKLVEKYGFTHISTGEVIRDEIKRGTELGREVEDFIARGELAPDEMVLDMVTDYMEEHNNGAGNIFDGFPRTNVQAAEFENILFKHELRVDVMIALNVPDEILIERLLLRGLAHGRKDDADVEVIANRIKIYKAQTAIVALYYSGQDKAVVVDGTGTEEEVFDRLCDVIDRIGKAQHGRTCDA